MNRAVQIVLCIVLLVVMAGGSFFGGMVYGEGQDQSGVLAPAGVGFAGGPPGGYSPGQGGQGGALVGEITSFGNGFIMITDSNGKQTKVAIADTTLIEETAQVKLADLANGDTVVISGSMASDGTYNARSVQVAPAGRFGGQGNGATPQAPSQ